MIIAFLLLLLAVFPPYLRAAQEETLEPVVVTATRIETPEAEVTTSISVITAEDIKAAQAETVLEVLRQVPGLDVVQSGSRGNTTSVFIRGSNSNQVLVLIDGMEINSVTAGLFNFAHLLTDNVERIEILRGAGGTLYGSKAVGGVIHIITKRGKGAPAAMLSAEGGNGRTHRESLGITGGSESWDYSITGGFLKTDGFRSVNDDYRNAAASTRMTYRPMSRASLTGTFWLTETRLGLFNSNVASSAPDPNDRQEDQFLMSRGEWRHRPDDLWDYRLSVGFTRGHERNVAKADSVDTEDSVDRIRPRIVNPEFQINYRPSRLADFIFGFDWDMRKAKFNSISPKQNNQAVYLQNHWRLLDEKLFLSAGARWDHNEDFGSEWSPSFSAAYRFPQTDTKLKWSYAEGFRAPTFNDLFFPGFSNPNLEPERSWEINLGVEQPLWAKQWMLEVIYFHREVKDLIQFAGLAPGNLGQVIFDGTELILSGKLPWGFGWKGNYTFMNASDRLTRRPKHKGNILLGYQAGPLNLHLTAHVIGRRLDVDAVSFATIDKGGYSRFDLAWSYRLPWKFQGAREIGLYGKIENFLNKKYEQADGFRARPLNFLFGIRGVLGKE